MREAKKFSVKPSGTYGGRMIIRREQPRDATATAKIQQAAFGRADERVLLDNLKAGGHIIEELCFVAEADGAVIGHIVTSAGTLAEGSVPAIGPIGVLPDHQGRGVGSALMHAAIAAADALEMPLIVLLGNPKYYGRFGFVAASEVGVDPPDEAWGAFFQARTLTAHDSYSTGRYEYPQPFDDV